MINPLSPAELVIDHSVQVDDFGTTQSLAQNNADRVRAQPGALRVPALGPERVPELPRRAAEHRHRAPGEPRVPEPRGVREAGRQRHARVSRLARRHRLAHDDDQRPRRARLGRRRHRGRGRDARPADHDADSAGRRLRAHGQARRRRDRHRPRAHGHARCCARRAWSASSSSSSATASTRLPLADRATIGNMSPEFGSTCAVFPIDAETLRYLELSGRPTRADRRSSRRTRRRRACGAARSVARYSRHAVARS